MSYTDVALVRHCAEATQMLLGFRAYLSPIELDTFLTSTISFDGNEWHIASGPNIMSDRWGFGFTIAEAVRSYFDYLKIN